jgi:hypothetical protein
VGQLSHFTIIKGKESTTNRVRIAIELKVGYTHSMPADFATYIGVSASSGRKPFTYLAIDTGRKLLALGTGSMVDVLSFALGQTSALLALSPPPRPNHPESEPVALNEYLRQLEFEQTQEPGVPRTPPAGCPGWLRASFSLAEQLETLGYAPFPAEGGARQWVETQSQAGFHSLLGTAPFQAGTLEGRIQRQLVLTDQELDVPDAMDFFEEITRYRLLHGILPVEKILPQPELDAWLAAHVAWLAAKQPKALRKSGEAQDGHVYLPVKI